MKKRTLWRKAFLFVVAILVLAPTLPAAADTGINVKTRMDDLSGNENLFYGNALGSSYGSLLKLQYNNGVDRMTVDRSGNMTLSGYISTVRSNNICDASGNNCFAPTSSGMDTTNDSWTGTGNVYMTSGNVGIGTTDVSTYRVYGRTNLGGWGYRFDNDANGSKIYVAHGGGYGLRVNAGTNASASSYLLELYSANGINNNSKFQVTGNGNVVVNGSTVIDGNAGWHRSYGSTGWYNGTYGGGWYMTDSSWIRSYGDKNIYQNTGVLRTDGTFQVGSSGGTLNVDNGGNFAYRTNVLFANTSGNVGIGTASPASKLSVGGQAGFNTTAIFGGGNSYQTGITGWSNANFQKTGIGVTGYVSGNGTNTNIGVWGQVQNYGDGVYGQSLGAGNGVHGFSSTGLAGYFEGSTRTTGRTETGNTSTNYLPASSNWNYTLQLNGSDYTSIGFHDSENSVSSIRYTNKNFYIGYDDGWGVSNTTFGGNIQAANVHATGMLYSTAGLSVLGGVTFSGDLATFGNIGTEGNITSAYGTVYAGNGMKAVGGGGSGSKIQVGSGSIWSSGSDNYINFGDGDHSYVWIGESGGADQLHLYGRSGVWFNTDSVYKPSGGTFYSSSDSRLKKDVSPLSGTEALDKLNQLNPVTFKWKNPEEHDGVTGYRASVIAQNLKEVFPDWVEETTATGKDKDLVGPDGKTYTISYPNDFNAYLIEAIKELKKQNDDLKARVEDLENKIK